MAIYVNIDLGNKRRDDGETHKASSGRFHRSSDNQINSWVYKSKFSEPVSFSRIIASPLAAPLAVMSISNLPTDNL